jgi:thiamine biosynthesis lipoprotein
MGSSTHVVVEIGESDGVALLDSAQLLLLDLERKWTRFSPSSELSRVNDFAPDPVAVSQETFDLVRLAVEGWRTTNGQFDPTVGTAMVGLGYDRSFPELDGHERSVEAFSPADGCSGVILDDCEMTIAVPTGTNLDLGGVGKGYAADLVATHMLDRGAVSAFVNVGGDARFVGGDELDGGWTLEVEDPFDATRSLAILAVMQGGVATSARTRRRWVTSIGDAHHLIDPATGIPANTGVAQVTVLAAEAAWAEIIAKAAFLAGGGEGPRLVASSGAAALFVTDTGRLLRAGGIEAFER